VHATQSFLLARKVCRRY